MLDMARLYVDDFNPRSPRGGATLELSTYPVMQYDFNPRSPRGGATPQPSKTSGLCLHFNPRSPRGGATVYTRVDGWLCPNFNPRSPRGGATLQCKVYCRRPMAFQSTLPTRGSDHVEQQAVGKTGISIHAPHEGERLSPSSRAISNTIFQSTLPTRGSDHTHRRVPFCPVHFNPRSPRGGATTAPLQRLMKPLYFNPRSPRGGATTYLPSAMRFQAYFNPRSPRGGATNAWNSFKTWVEISIHAPHEGERHMAAFWGMAGQPFQSTLPTRGSDHAPAEARGGRKYFNPRSPRGGATPDKSRQRVR